MHSKRSCKLLLQAFELGQAKWQFDNTRQEFERAMRQFAPGFGAGKFLAKAIEKRSARACILSHNLTLCSLETLLPLILQCILVLKP